VDVVLLDQLLIAYRARAMRRQEEEKEAGLWLGKPGGTDSPFDGEEGMEMRKGL
jgi:hypothetical protein